MEWNLQVAMGEMIGSFILTLGVMLLSLIPKDKFSAYQNKILRILAVFGLVVIGITTARGFGAPGFINPAIWLMVSIYKQSFFSMGLIVNGFNLLGALLAAIAYIVFTIIYNKNESEKVDIKASFQYNKQKVSKIVYSEVIANIFWLLPVIAMVALQIKSDDLHIVGEFFVPVTAGFAIVATLIIMGQIGVANLNPQIWFGELVVKLVAHRKKTTLQDLAKELTSVISIMSVATALGFLALAINGN